MLRLVNRLFGLVHLASRRLLHNWMLYAVLLCGWITAIALATAIPAYMDAVHQRLLRLELQTEASARRPAFGFLFLSLDNVSHPVQPGGDRARRSGYQLLAPYMETALADTLKLPVRTRMHYVRSDLFQLFPAGAGSYGRGDTALGRVNLGFISDLEIQATLVAGHMPILSDETGPTVEVLVHRNLANRMGLQAGEVYVLYRAADPDPQSGERAYALPIRIAGIWEAAAPAAAFWYIAPSAFENTLLTTSQAYVTTVSEHIPRPFFDTGWYVSFDGSAVRAEGVPALLQRMAMAQTQVQQRLPGTHLILSPENALLRYRQEVARQSPLLLVLSLPVLGLILLFVMLSAASLVARQQMEIAILRSRGSSGLMILVTYLVQGGLLSVAALLAGLPSGLMAARFMGPASAWLAGDGIQAPALLLAPALTRTSLLYAGTATILVNIATLVPVLRYARTTVVQAERHLSRAGPAGARGLLGLDILVAGAGAYGWYLLHTQGHFALPGRFQGVALWENPLLFLTPCLWLWTGARLLAFLLPWLCRGLERALRALPGLSLLLAMRNLARQTSPYAALLTLLLLTTGLGTFVTSLIRTLDDNLADRALYAVGSSIAVTENAKRFAQAQDGTAGTPVGWSIPPFDAHFGIAGVQAAARVGQFAINISDGTRSHEAVLFGIDRSDWPAAGYFRTDFAAHSLGSLMNELALAPDGVLVSTHLLEATGYALGDAMAVRGLIPGSGASLPVRIVGTLRYFPTAYPPAELFVVGNLDYIFAQIGGAVPYHVWLRVDSQVSGAAVRTALEERSIEVLRLEDARTQLEAWRTQPGRLGMFGFLTLGFGTTLLLSVLALAVHAVLSLQKRRIQLGILHAVGWSRRRASISLALEQLTITCMGIGGGALLGYGTSRTFVPFLQGGMTIQERIPPFLVHISWEETLLVSGVLLATVAFITVVMMAILARTRMFEVLKLGELHG